MNAEAKVKSRNAILIGIGFVFLFFFLIITPIVKSIYLKYSCLSMWDFGIYQQALLKSSFADLNPWISVRETKILNDHFDPITILWGILLKPALTVNSTITMVWFEWIHWLIILIFSIIVLKNKKANAAQIWLSCFFIIFCKAITQAFGFPLHPTTWAIVPFFLIVNAMLEKKYTQALLFGAFLCLYKETYVFSFLFLGSYFLIEKKYKHLFLNLIVAGLFFVFNFKFRTYFFGETIDYTSRFLSEIKNDPVQFFIVRIKKPNYDFQVVLTMLVPLYFLIKTKLQEQRAVLISISLMSLAVFGIHFLYGVLILHHGILVMAPWIAYLALQKYPIENLKKWQITLVVVVTYLASSGFYQRQLYNLFSDNPNQCVKSQERLNDLAWLKNYLQNEVKVSTAGLDRKDLVDNISDSTEHENFQIMATGDLIPNILNEKRNVVQFTAQEKNISNLKYLILSLNKKDYDVYPLEQENLNKIISQCKLEASQIEARSTLILLAGNFSKSTCYR